MERECKMSSVVSDLSFAKKFYRGRDYSSRFFLYLSLSLFLEFFH